MGKSYKLNGHPTVFKKGMIPWNKIKKGYVHKKRRTGSSQSGENHYRWIKDRTKVKLQIERNNPNDKQWKYGVYKRDYFKCRTPDENCSGQIEAHHILNWKDYSELRYIINNGITLCHAHHPRGRAEEKRLNPYFQDLMSVSN